MQKDLNCARKRKYCASETWTPPVIECDGTSVGDRNVSAQPNNEGVTMALETWVMLPGWGFLDQYSVDGFLDHLQEAGVNNLVFGATPPVLPDPASYQECGIEPTPPPTEIMARADAVAATFEKAKARGMGRYHFGTNPGMSLSDDGRHMGHRVFLDEDLSRKQVEGDWSVCLNCPTYLSYYEARINDVQRQLPADGIINDGPEFGYEISPGFSGNMFTCFCPDCARKAEELGLDIDRIQQAVGRLRRWLHQLTPQLLGNFEQTQSGLFDAFDLSTAEPALHDWLQLKCASVDSFVEGLCRAARTVDSGLTIGIGSRTPAFATLTGHNLARIARHADFLLPKHYLWMGGYDGLYGTVYRWARTLKEWNPQTPEALIFRFLYRLFGFTLPEVESLEDLSRYVGPDSIDNLDLTHEGEPFPDAFFSEVVASETRKMIRGVGDPSRVVPWVCVSHGGRILTPDELDRLLSGAEDGGLTNYLYYSGFEGEDWEVAKKHAGR
jgi:hypothetical protein